MENFEIIEKNFKPHSGDIKSGLRKRFEYFIIFR